MKKLYIFIFLGLLNALGFAQDSNKVMLLGVYHFDNPGQDNFNSEVGDYFSETRQKEISEVVEKMKIFKPTKIFVEANPNKQFKYDSLYRAFQTGNLKLEDLPGGRNEIYQLGFKLAKQLNHTKVYAVDAEGYWLMEEVQKNFN